MFARRYFPSRHFAARFFGDGGSSSSSVPGAQFFGRRYFGVRVFGSAYYGPGEATTSATFTVDSKVRLGRKIAKSPDTRLGRTTP